MRPTNTIKPSRKDINYSDLFELNYNYYRIGYGRDQSKLDTINFYINPLFGGLMKMRFENTSGKIKSWLPKSKFMSEHAGIGQIVLDFLYDNHRRWEKFQLVIPTVTLTEEQYSNIPGVDVVTWVPDMKKAIAEDNKDAAKDLHKQLTDGLLKLGEVPMTYRKNKSSTKDLRDIHIIAENQTKKKKMTVNLYEVFGREVKWDPYDLVFDSIIDWAN